MKGITRRTAIHWGCASAVGLYAPCWAAASEPKVVVPSYNTLTDTQEIELGTRFAAQVEKEQQIVRQSLIDLYLGGLIKELSDTSQRPNLPYTLKLVNSFEVNAFSLPGGFLYVNRGLVQQIKNEDELVATLSHELGHVVGRHPTNQLLLNLAAKKVLDRTIENLGKDNQIVEQIIQRFGGALAMLALLHFSRQDELQADMLGFYEMLRAGWDPKGFLQVLQTLEAVEQEAGSQQSAYLSTHPPTADRAAAIRHELAQVTLPASPRVDSITFQAFKLAMNLLPDPPKHGPGEVR